MKKLLPLFLIICCHFLPACQTTGTVAEEDPIAALPDPVDRVNDFEGLLTPEQENVLSALIAEYEAETQNRILIVTVEDVAPYDNLFAYGKALGAAWEIGEENNGLLIILSRNLREVRLATELGTTPVIPEEATVRITDTAMIPLFKEDAYFDGLQAGLEEIIRTWRD